MMTLRQEWQTVGAEHRAENSNKPNWPQPPSSNDTCQLADTLQMLVLKAN